MPRIDEAVIAMLADMGHITKDKKNAQQGYNFRGIDDVYNTVHPLLAKHGVYPTCRIVSLRYQERETAKGGVLFYCRGRFEYTFHATDGSTVTSEAVGEAMDSGDKASNKAMSNAYKYALFQLLCIPTEAVDGDRDSYTDVKPLANATGSGKAPTAKPAFVWSTANSADRKAYIMQRITAIKQMADPVQAVEQLKNIINKLKPTDLSPEDQAAVIDVIVKAEQDIMAENS